MESIPIANGWPYYAPECTGIWTWINIANCAHQRYLESRTLQRSVGEYQTAQMAVRQAAL